MGQLDLREATFFGQDWGGMIGLRVVAEMPDRFARVVVSNTGMAARDGITAWLFENFVKFMVWWGMERSLLRNLKQLLIKH